MKPTENVWKGYYGHDGPVVKSTFMCPNCGGIADEWAEIPDGGCHREITESLVYFKATGAIRASVAIPESESFFTFDASHAQSQAVTAYRRTLTYTHSQLVKTLPKRRHTSIKPKTTQKGFRSSVGKTVAASHNPIRQLFHPNPKQERRPILWDQASDFCHRLKPPRVKPAETSNESETNSRTGHIDGKSSGVEGSTTRRPTIYNTRRRRCCAPAERHTCVLLSSDIFCCICRSITLPRRTASATKS